jgi:predicted choloylglycine hydrolase
MQTVSNTMFHSDVTTYRIDLEQSESERWATVIAREKDAAAALVKEAAQEFERVPELVRWIFARLYQRFGGLYRDEMAAWASGLGVSLGTVTMLNCAYELSHLPELKILGCTTGVRWLDGLGMVHVRNLDWPLATMGAATRLFRFHRGSREFVSVGVPGQVGVLSGMRPGGYSVTINWAPPAAFPSFEFGPAFLLRDTLENCDSFDAAVNVLEHTTLSTSVFYTVCGTEKDQACVIERGPQAAVVRPLTGPPLVQANHHSANRFAKNNAKLPARDSDEPEFSIWGSSLRAERLGHGLAALAGSCPLENTVEALNLPAVLNRFTCQQMAFCPRTGDVKVWRRGGA